MDVVVLGGGEAGSHHARQLLKARRRGEASGRLVVVDRDPGCQAFGAIGDDFVPVVSEWLPFLQGWIRTAGASDMLVPAPVAPHLTWEWLAGELDARFEEPPRGWALPYEQPGPGMELYLSAAVWAMSSDLRGAATLPGSTRPAGLGPGRDDRREGEVARL